MNLLMNFLQQFILLYFIKSCISQTNESPDVCDRNCTVQIGVIQRVFDELKSQHQLGEKMHAEILDLKSELSKTQAEILTLKSKPSQTTQGTPTNCMEVGGGAPVKSDLYTIQDSRVSPNPFIVWCDMETDNGGWLVIQRRVNADVDFNRNWNEYKAGFGNLSGNYWIGLEKLNALTATCEQEWYIKLETSDGKEYYAKYGLFEIGSEAENYMFKKVDSYTGNAGYRFEYRKGEKFSTYDRDNDELILKNCASDQGGGWWYSNCYVNGLNGYYIESDNSKILSGLTGFETPLKYVQMMLRPTKKSMRCDCQ